MKCIKLLLESGASIVDDYDINGRSLIHQLVIHGGKLPRDNSNNGVEGSQITYSITFPMQNNQNDNRICEDISLISWILENIPQAEYSKVLSKDAFERRPLHYAAIGGFGKITKILLDFCIIRTEQFSEFSDTFWFDNDGFTPLSYAITRGNAEVVNCILEVRNNGI